MAKFVVDEFVVELGLSDKITRGLGKLEKAAQTAASRIERNLNKAFNVDGAAKMEKQFAQIVRQSANAGKQINKNLTKAFDINTASKQGMKQFETQANSMLKRVRKTFRDGMNLRGGTGGAGAGGAGGGRPPRGGKGGGSGTPRNAGGVESSMHRSFSQNMYGGLQRRLENVGLSQHAAGYRADLQSLYDKHKGTGNIDQFRTGLGQLNDKYKRLVTTTVANERALRRSRYMQEAATNSMQNLVTGFASVYTALEVFKKALDMGLERQSANMAAGFVFGKAGGEQGKKDTEQAKLFADEMATQLGLSYTDTLKGLTKFTASAAPAMGVGGAESFYKTQTAYGRLMGLSADEMKHAGLAFEQMASKGKVSAEELKGQLAEAMPGAEQLFAKALYGDEKKTDQLLADMKDGKLKAEDVLPKVAKLMDQQIQDAGGYEKISKSTQASLGRLTKGLEDFSAALFTGFAPGFGELVDSIAAGFENTQTFAQVLGEVLGGVFETLTEAADAIGTFFMQVDGMILLFQGWVESQDKSTQDFIHGLTDLAKNFGEAALGIGLLNKAMGILDSLLGGGMIGGLLKKLGVSGATAGEATAAGGEAAATAGLGEGAVAATGVAAGGFRAIPAMFWAWMLNKKYSENQNEAEKSGMSMGEFMMNKQGYAPGTYDKNSWIPAPLQGVLGKTITIPNQAQKPVETKNTLTVDMKVNGQPAGQKVMNLNNNKEEALNVHSSFLDYDFSVPTLAPYGG